MAPASFERIGTIEIAPASLAQYTTARSGQLVEVTEDVQSVANALAQIDPHIHLRFSEVAEIFCVYYQPESGDEYLIFTAQDLDHRIVKRMEETYARCNAPGYSFADEVERDEAKQKHEADHAWREENGELMEKLGWALREDSNRNQHKIAVPKDVAA